MWMRIYSGMSSREFVYMLPKSAHENLAPSVDMVLLIRILVVSRLATSVLVSPSYMSRSPPTVSRVQLTSSFCGRLSQQNRA